VESFTPRLQPRADVLFHPSVGEDALANLSIEKTEEGNIQGHVRIRSKTQGIALSLGERAPDRDQGTTSI
jgi:hypothetical protein